MVCYIHTRPSRREHWPGQDLPRRADGAPALLVGNGGSNMAMDERPASTTTVEGREGSARPQVCMLLAEASSHEAASPVIDELREPTRASLNELIESAAAEGFRIPTRLCEEYADGANRFDRPGEVLLGAWIEGRLVAVCGLNRDPYTEEQGVGRVRRLYVLPNSRRRGVARALVGRIIDRAKGRFRRLRVFTESAEALAFYDSLGFERIEGEPRCSHAMRLHGTREEGAEDPRSAAATRREDSQ